MAWVTYLYWGKKSLGCQVSEKDFLRWGCENWVRREATPPRGRHLEGCSFILWARGRFCDCCLPWLRLGP